MVDIGDKKTVTSRELAEVFVESYMNGNRSWVIEEVRKLPSRFAASVTAYVMHILLTDQSRSATYALVHSLDKNLGKIRRPKGASW